MFILWSGQEIACSGHFFFFVNNPLRKLSNQKNGQTLSILWANYTMKIMEVKKKAKLNFFSWLK
jgi:hypothetical protein